MDLNWLREEIHNRIFDDPNIEFLNLVVNHIEELLKNDEGLTFIETCSDLSRLFGKARYRFQEESDPKWKQWEYYSAYASKRGIDKYYKLHLTDENKKLVQSPGYAYCFSMLFMYYGLTLHHNQRYFAAQDMLYKSRTLIDTELGNLKNENYVDQLRNCTSSELSENEFDLLSTHKNEFINNQVGLANELLSEIDGFLAMNTSKIAEFVPDKYSGVYKAHAREYLLQKQYYGRLTKTDQSLLKELNTNNIRAISADIHNALDSLLHEDVVGMEYTQEQQSYVDWIFKNNYSLSFLSTLDGMYGHVLADDLTVPQNNEKASRIFEDIVETFCHCRFIFYQYNTAETTREIEYCTRPGFKRDELTEMLIDCYVRLFTIFDKVSKEIVYLFNIGISKDGKNKFRSFNKLVNFLNNHPDPNPFINSLCQIKTDVQPRADAKEVHKPWPVLSTTTNLDRIRNHIVHSGLVVTDEPLGKVSDRQVAYLTKSELVLQLDILFSLTKEIIFNMAMAVSFGEKDKRTLISQKIQ